MAPAAPSTTTAPAPPLVAARTAVPLTTIWTPPTSCATPVPVVDGGTCRSLTTGCSWYSSSGVTTTRADVNFPFMTGPWAYTSDSCVPPGWSTQSYQSPAVGCPAGYVTGWSGRGLVASLTSLACCPSDFSSYNAYSGCVGTTRVSAGQTYYLRAQGFSTATTVESRSGVRTTLRAAVVTQSSTLTRTYTAPALVTVVAPPVLLVRDELAAGTGTSPSAALGTTLTTTGFSIFSLSSVVSIVATVGVAVGCLVVFCCVCYCCCRSRRRRRRAGGWNNNPRPAPAPAPAPVLDSPLARPTPVFKTPRRPIPASSPPRPPSPAFTPMQPPITLFNLPRPAANPASPVPKPSDGQKCQTCQTSCHADAKTWYNGCCSCRDTRTTVQDAMPKQQRISTYCRTCRDRWAGVEPSKCPASWHLDELECKHGLSKTCSSSSSSSSSSGCCLCGDVRTGRLTLDARLGAYCRPCARHWRAQPRPLTALPSTVCCDRSGSGSSSGPDSCARDPVGLLEYISRNNIPCCACADLRPHDQVGSTLADRTATYCTPCHSFYTAQPPASLPKKWRIRCRHGKKYVYAAAAKKHPPPDRCCCACTDTRTDAMSRELRVGAYCASCRAFWAGVADDACPDEWGLDRCAHVDAGTVCGGGGGEERRCCGCRDARTLVRTLMERVAGYCPPCRRLWLDQSKGNFPSHWEHGSGYFPTLKPAGPDDDKDDQKPAVAWPLEPTDKYRRMHDHGPRYGEPRFGEEEVVPAQHMVTRRQLPSMGSSSRNFSTWLDEASSRGDRTVSSGLPQEEKGLCRGTPSFSVLPTVSVSPAPVEGPQTLPRRQGEPSRTISRFGSAEWRREQDRRGLQFDKPQFDVLPEA